MIEQEIIIRRHKGGAISIIRSPEFMSFAGFIDLTNKAVRVMLMHKGYNKQKGFMIDLSKPTILKD